MLVIIQIESALFVLTKVYNLFNDWVLLCFADVPLGVGHTNQLLCCLDHLVCFALNVSYRLRHRQEILEDGLNITLNLPDFFSSERWPVNGLLVAYRHTHPKLINGYITTVDAGSRRRGSFLLTALVQLHVSLDILQVFADVQVL